MDFRHPTAVVGSTARAWSTVTRGPLVFEFSAGRPADPNATAPPNSGALDLALYSHAYATSGFRDLVALAIDDVPTATVLDHRLAVDFAWGVVADVVVERVTVVGDLLRPVCAGGRGRQCL